MVDPVVHRLHVQSLQLLAFSAVVVLKEMAVPMLADSMGAVFEQNDIRLQRFRRSAFFPGWPQFGMRKRTVSGGREVASVSPVRPLAVTAVWNAHGATWRRLIMGVIYSSVRNHQSNHHKGPGRDDWISASISSTHCLLMAAPLSAESQP